MTILALETSCDETSAAVVRDGCVLSNIVSSQIKLHSEYGGVVPELATREHLKNLPPVTESALHEAKLRAADLDAMAATQGPGLPAALMVGLKAAQSMAFALGKPFVGINHHEAHLYSPWIWGEPLQAHFEEFQPNVSLIVSGGHTLLVHVEAVLRHHVLGSTIDDAAGECFDKVGKLIGLPYPGGPQMDRLAEGGHEKRFDFPRPKLRDPDDDFSFSGLKTSVRYFLRDNPDLLDDTQTVRDLCASVQAAIVEVLVAKTMRAAERLNVRCVTASGGVTANRALRLHLASACESRGFTLRVADRSLCTDNAAMIGVLAERKLLEGSAGSSLDADIAPGLALT
ncbi:MAG TPA: tRNA (adenosine(37)-N6)-threonylcarbamoyltransferase complex transferase subunit TsaD [Methylomirabilota bacterium]|nr:tRNA (adenosine(37)-N6)-threonylcarbamoyltransferase complex transferase subunit TsaD [Methylomirabilota bacterium]